MSSKPSIEDVREWLKALVPAASTFVLRRTVDVSGISGTGVVADGVHFPDGKTVTRWRGGTTGVAQTCVWDSLAHVKKIHGHDGATKIEVVPYGVLVEMILTVAEVADGLDDESRACVQDALGEVLADHLEFQAELNAAAKAPTP